MIGYYELLHLLSRNLKNPSEICNKKRCGFNMFLELRYICLPHYQLVRHSTPAASYGSGWRSHGPTSFFSQQKAAFAAPFGGYYRHRETRMADHRPRKVSGSGRLTVKDLRTSVVYLFRGRSRTGPEESCKRSAGNTVLTEIYQK